MNRKHTLIALAGFLSLICVMDQSFAQLVCLPAPRLMTTMPMGGQSGTEFEVTITGQTLDDAEELSFSHPGITSTPKKDAKGNPVPLKYIVKISKDCPRGIYEARIMTRLGMSTSRAFSVDKLSEITQTTKNTAIESAINLPINSICNSVMTNQMIDHYKFQAKQGQRIVVDCATKGIDSKLNPVLIICNSEGLDLMVNRRGGALDFEVPKTDEYIIKVHGLTFKGGAYYFYRLAVQELERGEAITKLPSIKKVNAFSWPPVGISENAEMAEIEPNNKHAESQQISLPCDIKGSFYPAADVDTFEFNAKKGEVWWVEVASERLGHPTDPSIVVQQVTGSPSEEKLSDLVELSDIASPMKTSSNGYSYDGPPYNAGSSDIIGKVEIKQDGIHRLQVRDLFGGTRNDPSNKYRMIIRKAAPDFAIVGWALHMNLRNGDRSAYSKPIALRAGTTMPIEVVAIRRDGFDEEIELVMENLPKGVTATGLKIPKGKERGIIVISVDENAPRGFQLASLYGQAKINGEVVKRQGQLASMQWPVRDGRSDIPSPKLIPEIPVSVSGNEKSTISVAAKEDKVWEVTEGEKLTIPLVLNRRCDFSGANISLKTWGTGFDRAAAFDASLKNPNSDAVLDLAKLKTKPGEYQIAFYGYAVAKYQDNPQAIKKIEAELKKAEKEANKPAITLANRNLKKAIARAKAKDIVDIIVSKPITIRVNPKAKNK